MLLRHYLRWPDGTFSGPMCAVEAETELAEVARIARGEDPDAVGDEGLAAWDGAQVVHPDGQPCLCID